MREELPREITKEAKVTGTPLADSAPAAGLDDASFEAAWDWKKLEQDDRRLRCYPADLE